MTTSKEKKGLKVWLQMALSASNVSRTPGAHSRATLAERPKCWQGTRGSRCAPREAGPVEPGPGNLDRSQDELWL